MGGQMHEEREKPFEPQGKGTSHLPVGTVFNEYTYNVVKRRWQEQGIWDDTWVYRALGRWKHEKPSCTPSTSSSEDDSEPARGLFGTEIARSKRRKKIHLTVEQRAQREQDRRASRPIHQFLWQIHKERD
ncbi:MAG: hypothetical protein L6R39_007771, partial [Caloplaca ligustica]